MNLGDTTDCEDCKRLQSGLTWIGNETPKCPKHSKNTVTFTGGLL